MAKFSVNKKKIKYGLHAAYGEPTSLIESHRLLNTGHPGILTCFVGRLIKSLEPRLLGKEEADSVPVTDHLFLVTELTQGNLANGAELLVTQTGGKWKGSDFVATDLAQFEPGLEKTSFLVLVRDEVLKAQMN